MFWRYTREATHGVVKRFTHGITARCSSIRDEAGSSSGAETELVSGSYRRYGRVVTSTSDGGPKRSAATLPQLYEQADLRPHHGVREMKE